MKPILLFVIILAWAASVSAITIDTVPIGDVGNPSDPTTANQFGGPLGGVNYAYNIGKYEVTVGQYTAFLNAVAATDTYALYNARMATDLNVAGIARSGTSGGFTYNVIGSPNHPITYVSWGDAARFVNWLHNGQPTGAQDSTTTENGAYGLFGATTQAALGSPTRRANAKWFIPTQNEWNKAAFYQPVTLGGDSDSYWAYATKTNSPPYSDQPPGATPDNTRVGNWNQTDGVANGYDDGYAVTGSTVLSSSQNYLTDVGAYTSSPSYYGTFDQAGNVREWSETSWLNEYRGLSGGSWSDSLIYSSSANPSINGADPRFNFPNNEFNFLGFRVATIFVPEPASFLLLFAGLFGFVCTARRR
jgi:sulfatase modifying factor 1